MSIASVNYRLLIHILLYDSVTNELLKPFKDQLHEYNKSTISSKICPKSALSVYHIQLRKITGNKVPCLSNGTEVVCIHPSPVERQEPGDPHDHNA